MTASCSIKRLKRSNATNLSRCIVIATWDIVYNIIGRDVRVPSSTRGRVLPSVDAPSLHALTIPASAQPAAPFSRLLPRTHLRSVISCEGGLGVKGGVLWRSRNKETRQFYWYTAPQYPVPGLAVVGVGGRPPGAEKCGSGAPPLPPVTRHDLPTTVRGGEVSVLLSRSGIPTVITTAILQNTLTPRPPSTHPHPPDSRTPPGTRL